MKPLLVVGCGGHSRSLIDLIESIGKWQICGLVGLPNQVGTRVLGYPVIGSDQDLPTLRVQYPAAVIGIGQIPEPTLRQRIAAELTDIGFQIPLMISPHAYVSPHAQLGVGTTVFHSVIVNAGAIVDSHCILNSRALIEHDVEIGSFCHISTGVLLNGGVSVGNGSFIGSGAMIREGLHLPPHTVIGAGKRVMGWPQRNQ